MRYIGSKASTLPWLTEVFARKAPDARSLCDPFAGTCVVPRHFKRKGMMVTTGDLLHLSHVLQRATLGLRDAPTFDALRGQVPAYDGGAHDVLQHLQRLPGTAGYIYDHYSEGGAANRRFFTADNAVRIDAIRTTIATWLEWGLLNPDEEAYLLASLVDAADRVANTAGTYYAYLKQFNRRSSLPLQLRPPAITGNGGSGGCHLEDASVLVARTRTDILYLDPPYNERDYSAYYHLPETIVTGDRPDPKGRSGIPGRSRPPSSFYRKAQAGNALARICSEARARYIAIHYTTRGIIPHESIMDALAGRGDVSYEDRAVRAYSSSALGNRATAGHRLYWCRVRKELD